MKTLIGERASEKSKEESKEDGALRFKNIFRGREFIGLFLKPLSKGSERSEGGDSLGIYDVHATPLIEVVAKKLQKELKQPEFAAFVKTSANRERAPQREDWWFVRAASILYRLYKEGPLGVESLRTYYGGRKRRGVKPAKFRKASGKIIRTCLQELEKVGYVEKAEKGRKITPKGISLLSKAANEAKELLAKGEHLWGEQKQTKIRIEKKKGEEVGKQGEATKQRGDVKAKGN